MSAGLPYPVSNNRASYPPHDPSPTYPSNHANHAYQYPPFSSRSANFDTNHGRTDPTVTSSSLSGMFHHAEHDQPHHYSRTPHPVDAFSHHTAPLHSRDHLWQYDQHVPDPSRARFDHSAVDVGLHREYQSPVPHTPSVAGPSHGHTLLPTTPTSPSRAAPSASSAGRSRREKPRLELAPDQPLTTQGKPRSRVYVACVQCRNRKIRCDGAKPICHNCSRKGENPGICSYDAAPKRRGPDRVPGARQRSAGGSGERLPRRRRRPVPLDVSDQPFLSPQSASQSPVDSKTAPFSPTAHSFMPDTSTPRQDNLTVMQEVGPGQYTRHRQGLPDTGRTSVPGGGHSAHAHYPQHHALSNSHTPAAAYEAHPLGSPLSDMPAGVRYVVGAPMAAAQTMSLPPRHYASEITYGFGEGEQEDEDGEGTPIAPDPGLQFTRETWWDALLVLYASDDGRNGRAPFSMTLAMPPGLRENTTQSITADLRSIFRASPHWMNFINLPRFFSSLLDTRARHSIQPSLILGALALATFFRSHENELGERGRERALMLRDQAQAALEGSLNSRWIDHSLVQAAWLLAFFEICAHPLHSTTRVRSSMGLLDSLLQTMKLLSLDEADPRTTVFSSVVPVVPHDSPACYLHHSKPASMAKQWAHPDLVRPGVPAPEYQSNAHFLPPQSQRPADTFLHTHPQNLSTAIQSSCNCTIYTLGHTWPMVKEFAPLWDTTPTWQGEWTESDIRKEECRRLVWSSVMLSAGHSSYTAASSDIQTQQLFLMDPRNYALLFPGESLTSVDDSPAVPPPAKDSVWALYMRAMLMWHSCILMRGDANLSHADKAQFALTAWTEIDAIEEALNRHTCDIERSFLFQGRELLFNSRLCIAYEFQRCLPQPTAHANLLFYRQKAEEWLSHQASLAKRVLSAGLPSVTGLPAADLAKRPFLLFWFMSQIERCASCQTERRVYRCTSWTSAFACLTCAPLLPLLLLVLPRACLRGS
ncbi:hypothetical protein C8Q80DRAFT_1142298 [Daedaleopsis nitida]|nr:hypothetical protein C8Q80DRAFT_1142298 [Daedaleopsis nitida]